MKKLKIVAALLSVFCIASAWYTAPDSSRSTISDHTPSPTPRKSTSPSPTPKKKGEKYEQALKDYNAKEFDKAADGFKEVLASEPNHSDANFYLGQIYFDKKEFETSLPLFEKALKTDHKSVPKMMALGENQRVLKKFDVAVVQFQKVIGFAPQNPNAYFGLGQTYVGLNNKIAARQQLTKLKELDKGLAEILSKQIDAMK